jgi:hypothetical protein
LQLIHCAAEDPFSVVITNDPTMTVATSSGTCVN